MGELQSALDALAGDDVRSLAPRLQLDGIAELLAARNRIDAELARRVRAAELQQAPEEGGLTSMQSWLRGHGRLSPAAAGQLVRNGRVLDHLPALASAFAAGVVTAEQVAVVAPVAKAGGPAPSSSPTRRSRWPTTSWPPATSRSCALSTSEHRSAGDAPSFRRAPAGQGSGMGRRNRNQ